MSENVDLTRRAIQAFNDRDLEALIPMLDERVEAFPLLAGMEGGYHGHDGVRRWWAALFETFRDFNSEALNVRDAGDTGELTFATLHIRGHGAGSGTPIDATAWQVSRFRGGKCIGWRVFTSEREALEAARLRE